jgi:hypothetical protein
MLAAAHCVRSSRGTRYAHCQASPPTQRGASTLRRLHDDRCVHATRWLAGSGGSSTSAISNAIVDLDDAAPMPGRDRREAIALVFALSVVISSALFGRDSSVSIERMPAADADSFASASDGRVILLGPGLPVEDRVSDRSGGVTTSTLLSVSSLRPPGLVTCVFDRTGRVVLFVSDQDGCVIHGERGSVR